MNMCMYLRMCIRACVCARAHNNIFPVFSCIRVYKIIKQRNKCGAQRFSPTHGHARHASEWEQWVAASLWAPLLY